MVGVILIFLPSAFLQSRGADDHGEAVWGKKLSPVFVV